MSPKLVRRVDQVCAALLIAYALLVCVATPTFEEVGCLRSASVILRRLTIVAEYGIAIPYSWMPISLMITYKELRIRPEASLLVLYGLFITLCGGTHFVGALAIPWQESLKDAEPSRLYWLAMKLKTITAVVSIMVARKTDQERARILKLAEQQGDLQVQKDAAEKARAGEAQKNAELEEEKQKLQTALDVAERQRETILGLSTPMLPLGGSTMLVPIIGVLDSQRAGQVITVVLHQLGQGRADHTILDLTGVDMIDSEVGKRILELSAGIELMGGKLLITGIQPEVSQIMVKLGVSFRGVQTFRTIEKALRATGKIAP